MKLLGSTKKDVDKDKDGKIVPKLKFVEVVLVHCNLVKNDYQHTSRFVQDLSLKNGLKFMINQDKNTMLIKKLESKHQC